MVTASIVEKFSLSKRKYLLLKKVLASCRNCFSLQISFNRKLIASKTNFKTVLFAESIFVLTVNAIDSRPEGWKAVLVKEKTSIFIRQTFVSLRDAFKLKKKSLREVYEFSAMPDRLTVCRLVDE